VLVIAVGSILSAAGASGQTGTDRPSSLQTGFFDPPAFTSAQPNAWFGRATATGATVVRLIANWSTLEPQKASSPTNPANVSYQWGTLDPQIEAAVAAGLIPVVDINGAPRWAQPATIPRGITAGAWKPSAADFQQFAQALATRYSGTFPDPVHAGAMLPRVRYFQAWNEPNLSIYLAPQWRRVSGRLIAEGPILYRGLLNAFYAGIKAAQPDAVVVSGGTAPFGDRPGGQRIPPAEFVRDMLCLSAALKPLPCPDPVHFDVLDHHPYAVGGPYSPALNPDDVSIPDMAKLARPLEAAERAGRVLPAGSKPLWATEVSYDSSPPDPKGVPMGTLDRWAAETLYELWNEGVAVVTWYLIRDQAPDPSYAATYQSGMYFRNGTPKPEQRAFRFPLVVDRRGGGRPIVWTRLPVAGTLQIQGLVGGRWTTVDTLHVSRYEVVERHLAAAPGESFRARVGSAASLVFGP
jgi:polysaccharide biosynthesis protein PslG